MKLDILDEFTCGPIAFEFQTALHTRDNHLNLEKSQLPPLNHLRFDFQPDWTFYRDTVHISYFYYYYLIRTLQFVQLDIW